MTPTGRTLLVVNRASGTGHGDEVVSRLKGMLSELPTSLDVETVEDHPEARELANEYLNASEAPATIIAGGGSGTLRAVIEGLCKGCEAGELPGVEKVRVAALRMGSGNPLARQFGVPGDPELALRGIIANLHAGVTAPCCVMRCEVGVLNGPPAVHYAATMAGFGEFGRVPGDLDRWHEKVARPRRAAAGLVGIERVNNVEYIAAILLRFARHALSGRRENVEVRVDGRSEVMALLAGVAMSFPFGEMPVEPGVRVEDEAVTVFMIPDEARTSALRIFLAPRRTLSRALRFELKRSETMQISNLDGGPVEFFLDEDPTTYHSTLTLEVAGSLAFVPGPDYSPGSKGGSQ